ncbi:autotransporter outer membrane beta-barrel domain-containing protein [Candidatus Bartonella washoeensis]|uniref:Outer membrane autotransporter barrel domain-containing protein n=1 Tax=Cardidatus Bartonella washoeensis 085-0475 TaxID=1094564 RepID=J0Z6M8_9HYPH|nr:autotransporter outer membrane beta-barrel domain-containing protein [Bartonella washoeensis]EJF83313.1 outer membrane autotransporter barrel domain-containing protein [Bartonella washoeensis 085-0475]
MIKVFRNHVYLCTFTTAIFSLLQNGIGWGANAEAPKIYKITVTSVSPSMSSSRSTNIFPVSPSGEFSSTPDSNSINSLSGRRDYILSGLSGDNLEQGVGERSTKISGSNAGRPLKGEGGDRDGGRYVYVIDRDSDSNRAKKLLVYDGAYYMCNGCGSDTIDNKSYRIKSKKFSQYPSNAAITVKGIGTTVTGENVTIKSRVSDQSFKHGVYVSEGGKIVLKNPMLRNTGTALYADNGVIQVEKGIIKKTNKAVEAINRAFVLLEDTNIKTRDAKASILSYDRSEIWIAGGSIDFMDSHGVSSTLGGKVNLDDVKITGNGGKDKNHAVLHTDLGGPINFKGIIDVTNAHGILSENTVATPNSILLPRNLSDKVDAIEVNVTSSSVTVQGNGAHGIYFKGEKPSSEYLNNEDSNEGEKTSKLEAVNIRRTMFSVQDGVAIYSSNSKFGVVNLMQSTLSGHSLLRAEKGASLIVLADASTLTGSSYVDNDSTAKLYMGTGSTWILQQRAEGLTSDSSLSLVSLMGDSSINFKKLQSAQTYEYQTLRIGKGLGQAYIAQDDGAYIYLNTYLNSGGSLNNQKTDRVLIDGDVAGRTTVHVRGVSGSPGGYTGSGGNNQGISIIQVSGKAEHDSFQLDGGYVALGHSPYKYKLYAYGPTSDLGKAHPDQRLVKGNGEFWDFRLENQYISPKPGPAPEPGPTPSPGPAPSPEPRPKPGVKAVVPQVSTYLLLPNALFHTGLMNIGNQSKRLAALRIVSGGLLKSDETPAFFVRGYGGSNRYVSNLSALEYGYGGEFDYNAIEAGVLLQTTENAYGTASFGVIGSYEGFSLQPLDVEQSQKSKFDKWSVTAYGGMQHDAGFYVDGLLSYGLFKGDVLTLARGKTATLKGTPLSASLTAGKALMIGDEGFVFDPQIQVVYQRLHFNKVRDIDKFDIEMGKLDQWVARIGGHLAKTLTAIDDARVISFYGKLHLAHSFGAKQFVHFKDAFQLGAFGSSLETGLGFNAQLSPKFVLHGDLSYQHTLTKAGFSGTSFSGGLRYHF